MEIQMKWWLSYPDSNQNKQNQNLLCYHYTIGQSASTKAHLALLEDVAKLVNYLETRK